MCDFSLTRFVSWCPFILDKSKENDHTRLISVDNNIKDDSHYASFQDGSAKPEEENAVHVYPRRWLMLLLFCLYSTSNAMQWIQLNIISNITQKFYNASLPTNDFQRESTIDWLSMVYMLTYIPLIFPATWMLDKKGLRLCMVVGSLLNALAAWIKCASVREDLFGVVMFAQTLAAISQIWVLGIPARLAAVWFGPGEVSTATSLGVFGNQVGVALGFLIPPILVPNSKSLDDIATDMRTMHFGTAGITTAVFLLNLAFFQKEPPQTPSLAQQRQLELETHSDYGQSLKRLFKNRGFVTLMISYGMNTGSFYAVSTVLNTLILRYYPNEEVNAGRIGLTLVLAGILGSICAGLWLDKTRTFKGTSVAIYIMTTGSMAAFTFTLGLGHLWVVFLTGGLLGLTMTGYLPVGFEFAAELTFPESEGTSSGMLNASAQVFGIALTFVMRIMSKAASVQWANITVTIILFLGVIMTLLIKADYRRQTAGRELAAKITDMEVVVTAQDQSTALPAPSTAESVRSVNVNGSNDVDS